MPLLLLLFFFLFPDRLMAEDKNHLLSDLQEHQGNYIIRNQFQDPDQGLPYLAHELKVQFSFKKRIWSGLHFAYSQRLFWQVFDGDHSRPMREVNYNPEFFWDLQDSYIELIRLGLWEHESNGEELGYDEEGNEVNASRSWNRVYLTIGEDFWDGAFHSRLKLWQVTDREDNEYTSFFEDNRDIQQYLGHGELDLRWKGSWGRAELMLRKGWMAGTETGRLQIHIPFSLLFGPEAPQVEVMLYGFSGYGESLIDYNRKLERWGIGFSFN